MSFFGTVRKYIDDISEDTRVRAEYASRLEGVKGFLGERPREKLQDIINSEKYLKAALRSIKQYAHSNRSACPTVLYTIIQSCDAALGEIREEPND